MRMSKIASTIVILSSFTVAGSLYATMHNDTQSSQANESGLTNQGATTQQNTPDNQLNQLSSGQQANMSEQVLQQKVMNAVGQNAKDVQVSIKDNTAYLAGKLPSDSDYERVVTLVESIKGIRDVNVDDLGVQDSNQPLTDTYTTAKVKGALIKRDILGKDIPAWTIGVETKNGKVFLTGTVESEQQKEQILNVVNNLKDIQGVDNQLQVKQSDAQY